MTFTSHSDGHGQDKLKQKKWKLKMNENINQDKKH